MKKHVCIEATIPLILVILLLPGCSFFGQVSGAGDVISKQYNINDFTEIEIGTAVEFEIVPGDTYSVSLKTNENIFDYVDVYHSGKTLSIKMKPISYSKTSVVATIALPMLDRINLKGTAHGKVKGFKSAQSFSLQASGDSTLELDVEAGAASLFLSENCIIVGRLLATDLNLDLLENSKTSLNGSANSLTLKATGSTLANLPDYPLQNASLELAESSQAIININGTLNASLKDASKLDYSGNPTLGKIDIRDSSIISGP